MASSPLCINGDCPEADPFDVGLKSGNENLREIGDEAFWQVTSHKIGCGVQNLRDKNKDTFWQSDGPQPHSITIQFKRKSTISALWFYIDFRLDESYSPSKISIRSGSSFQDLSEVELVELLYPRGWCRIPLKNHKGEQLRTFMLQLTILTNHQNGRDSHLRLIALHSPLDSMERIGEFTPTTPNSELTIGSLCIR